MKKILALAIAAVMLLPLSACGDTKSPEWTETYAITGTEHTQLWDLEKDTFIELLNQSVSEEMTLSSLKPVTDDSHSVQLSANGRTWKILLDVFPPSELKLSWFAAEEGAEDWIWNVAKVELSLYADGENDAKQNGEYVRALIQIFTPGAEKIVEDAIGLYGDPEPEAVISEGAFRVSIGNVAYTYLPNENRFIVQPHMEPWPEKPSSPTVIKPD